MTRVPITAPLACFGLEHDPKDETCIQCAHQTACIGYMGVRKGRIRITDATFRLLPGEPEAHRAEEFDLCGEYVFATVQVFGKKVLELPSCLKDEEVRATILANVAELNCTVRLYMLTVMYAFKNQQPNVEFNPRFFIGGLAKANVVQYRDATRSLYASFCEDTVELLLSGKDGKTAEELFEYSETQFAEFIIGHKLRHSGNCLDELYRTLEIRLDPTWLATEATYKSNPQLGTSAAIRAHRYTAVRAHVAMKRNKNLREATFRMRERIIPLVADNVMSRYGYRAADFLIHNVPVRDVARFWSRLGLALQHLHCLRFLEGDPISARLLGGKASSVQLK